MDSRDSRSRTANSVTISRPPFSGSLRYISLAMGTLPLSSRWPAPFCSECTVRARRSRGVVIMVARQLALQSISRTPTGNLGRRNRLLQLGYTLSPVRQTIDSPYDYTVCILVYSLLLHRRASGIGGPPNLPDRVLVSLLIYSRRTHRACG